MRNIQKDARADAQEFIAATMAYGQGAGIRRRHIDEAVMYKMQNIPGYEDAFSAEKHKVDVAKAVKSAKRTGKTRDVGEVTSKNIRALARGDKNGMSTPLLVAIAVVAVAHQTGYDKKVVDYTKRKSGDVRSWLKRNL
jgi:hypothetical protein